VQKAPAEDERRKKAEVHGRDDGRPKKNGLTK
jgi:hypothetical protein